MIGPPRSGGAGRHGGRPGAPNVEAGSDDALHRTARAPRESTAGILIRFAPLRVFVLADNAHQEREVRGIARAVVWFIELLEQRRKAAA